MCIFSPFCHAHNVCQKSFKSMLLPGSMLTEAERERERERESKTHN